MAKFGRAKITDVAREAGVSTATVDRVLNRRIGGITSPISRPKRSEVEGPRWDQLTHQRVASTPDVDHRWRRDPSTGVGKSRKR